MAGIKISQLPVIPSSAFSDVGPFVQGGVTYQASLTQIGTLFGFDATSHLLSMASGGTNANLTAALGAIPYSTASAFALLAPGTSGQLLQSGGAGTPSWTTATFPAPGTSGNVMVSDGTNWTSSTTTNVTALGAQAQALNMNAHLINNVTDPVNPQDAATKNYVDMVGLISTSVYAASAASLGTVTQSGAGVGATLTNAGAQVTFALDGVNPPLNSKVLIKNTATGMTAANEGIYTVTNVGSGASNWVLTRATTYDSASEINATGLIVVQNGSTLVGTAWYNANTITTVDTDNFSFVEYGNIVFPVSLAHGGTNANLTASNGGIFYSTSTAGAILSGTATAGLALLSGSNAAPIWSTSPPFTQTVVQTFTSGTSTYTPTTGMKYCIVELVGGGGGGGGGAGVAATSASGGGGGGGGGYCRKLYTAASLGASATVVVGASVSGGASGNNPGTAGNNSTFTPAGAGVTLTASGGGAGGGGTATTSFALSVGGAGGTGTNGDLNIPGSNGTMGATYNGAGGWVLPGYGGASHFGPGASVRSPASAADGPAGPNYGSGGGGAFASNANQAGGAGAAGYCIITEYISV